MHDEIESLAGTLWLDVWHETWQGKLTLLEEPEPGVQIVRLELHSGTPQVPPQTELSFSFAPDGTVALWQTNIDPKAVIPPCWDGYSEAMLARNAPMFTLYGKDGNNRLSMACSDAFRTVKYSAGINEEDSTVYCRFLLFTEPEAPRTDYSTVFRIDTRRIFYADSVRAVFAWFETFGELKPTETPAAARELLYSSWYSYHKKGLYAATIEAEVLEAAKFGMKTLIVDDGWQCDKYDGAGAYAYCGDWEPVERRFPDMKEHVKKVHAAGLKYMLWYAVSLLGTSCKAYPRFKNMVLHGSPLGADILDPRFPEVREYLTGIYERAVKEWDLDGFKLDFIDSFTLAGMKDPAIEEDYAGRDCKTVPEGVDKLLSGVTQRLKAIKPDILIEFRQHYMGPAIRKYGNIIRAADCPSDPLSNKNRTLALRLSSGKTAVHSDMLSWNYKETPEAAAQQILAILFSVPQISVRIEELPQAHRDMLKYWTGFWEAHKTVLLDGYLKPYSPEQDYPFVTAETEQEFLAAVYENDRVVRLEKRPSVTVVNATTSETVILDSPAAFSAVTRDVFGRETGRIAVKAGLSAVRIPCSGTLERMG